MCPCGSGLDRWELRDARGIFCCFVCAECEHRKRSAFRPKVFTDPNYAVDEDVDND
jgi:hypothetical protein